MTIPGFTAKWRKLELQESSAAQGHFIPPRRHAAWCAILGSNQ